MLFLTQTSATSPQVYQCGHLIMLTAESFDFERGLHCCLLASGRGKRVKTESGMPEPCRRRYGG